MAGLCKATIIGNVGADPEMRYTQAGKPMTTFNVACNWKRRAPDGEMVEETQWFRILCFNRLAEFASEFLARGSRVFVEGRLQTRTWDAPDGQKRFTLEIMANEMVPFDQRPRGEAAEPAHAGVRTESDVDGEDLPF